MRPKLSLTVVATAFALLLLAPPVRAHTEDSPVAEHPPKTAFGLVSRGSALEVNDHRFAWSMTPFAEYAPLRFLSLGAALPWGVFDGEVLLSDLQLTAKGLLPIEALKIVPIFSVEVPTGSTGATSDHVELVPAVFLEKMLPPWHLFGLFGGRVALEGDGGHAADGALEVNALAPHAEREIYGMAGASYFVTSVLGFDARAQLFYEDFETLVVQPQAGVVFQYTQPEQFTFKASLSGFYATAGVRQGGGAGLSVYIAPE